MNTELAWAAGLFDAEGSASTYLPPQRLTRRRQMQVSQGGVRGTPPAVLVRFMDALGGVGNITGPYRDYLFYWKTTRNDVIDEISASIWPFLSEPKRIQLAKAAREVARTAPTTTVAREVETEHAWAAGFFDGEGCLYLTGSAASSGRRGVALYLPQASAGLVPETLTRFHSAVEGRGRITGPHAPRSPWSKLPQYHWRIGGRESVSAVLAVLWPWLGAVSRQRIVAAAVHLGTDLSRARGSAN